MERRTFLKNSLSVSAGLLLSGLPKLSESEITKWRVFEITTSIEIQKPSGLVRAWLPVPLRGPNKDYFRVGEDTWKGNASTTRLLRDDKYNAGFLYAEWTKPGIVPTLELTSRFSVHDRQADLRKPQHTASEQKRILDLYLQPTTLIPTDGIVAETSSRITKGAKSELDKARALYEWIVETTFRDPKVRGCGVGDIKTMLETQYFGGKCADINSLYVGLARAAGLPARDVYGLRVAPSEYFKCLGKTGDVTKAQHCRAEVYLSRYGWIPVDPADVRKVALEEPPGGLSLQDAPVRDAHAKMFGAWEMNWAPFNSGHDIQLPNSKGPALPFLMYPQAETNEGFLDCLDPDNFRYTIMSREITT